MTTDTITISYTGNLPTITYNGVAIQATQDAYLSNRVFPGSWGDAQEGEGYTAEWETRGEDADGNEYLIRWQFDAVRGEEPDDDSNWDWDNVDCISVRQI